MFSDSRSLFLCLSVCLLCDIDIVLNQSRSFSVGHSTYLCCRFCHTPPSIGAFKWEDDITKWPVSMCIITCMRVNTDNVLLISSSIQTVTSSNGMTMPRHDVN